MTRLAFAALLAVVAATAGGQTVYRLDASHHLTEARSGVAWSQDGDGVLLPEGARRNAAPATRAVNIRVYSAASRAPLAGALAWWVASDAGTPLLTQSSVAADEKGNLRVPLLSGLRLRVWADGYEVVELDAAEVTSLRELALWPGAAATLHVVETTTPVQIRYFLGARDVHRELSAVTDASGRIAWPGTPRDGIRVEVVDPRFVVAAVTLHAADKLELTLQRSPRITARVVDAEGRPIAKAKATSVVAVDADPAVVRRLNWTSDDAGAIALSGFPGGAHLVEFAADGFVSKSVRVDVAQALDLGQVRLNRGAPFVVIVRGDDGPIESARVSVEDGTLLSTDRSGRVTIAGLDVRQQPRLQIEATNYLSTTIDVRRDMKSPYEVRLHRGSGFRFRLLDSLTGDPIERVKIRVRTPTGWGDTELKGLRGEYYAAGFDGGRMQLRIAAPGYLPTTISAEPANGTADLGLLFLSRGAVVSGVLVDVHTGQPLAGARVETARRGEMGTMAARLFGDAVGSTTTAEGKFELSGLEPGVVCATVRHPAVGQIPLPIGAVDENSRHDIGVMSVGESGSLDGALRDSDGAPIADAGVDLRFGPVFSPCMSLAGAADDKGKYHFERVAPGPYHLVALRNHEVLGTRAVVVRGGATTHEDLEIRTVSVHGSVVVHDLPGNGGSVMLKRTGSEEFTPPTIFFNYVGAGSNAGQRPVTDIVGKASFSVGPDGTFEGKARLDEGDYEVVWTPADNSAWYHSWVSLSPDAKTLEVRLRCDGVAVSGRASASDGSPAVGALIRLIDGAGRTHRTTFAGADGAFVVPHVPPGTWIIEGAGRGLTGRQSVSVEAKPPAPLQLALAPKPSSPLLVRIDSNPDVPAIDSVVVTNAGGVVRMSRPNPSATFADLPPGAYRIFGLDRRGGIVAGDVVTMGPAGTTTTLIPRPTRNVRLRATKAEPGQHVALLRDRYSLAAVLAYEGLALSVLDDGTIAVPPLSDGRWTIRIGDRAHDIDVSRDDTFDLDD